MDKELMINNESIKDKIHYIRGKYVMLDRDLAELYEVEVKYLKRQVNRNIKRFPEDFIFELTKNEFDFLRCQNVTLEKGRGKHTKYLPYAFTEHGVTALAGVLKSNKAININIKIIRAFISMRNFLAKNKEVFHRLDNVERKQIEHDKNFEKVFDALSLNEPQQGVFFNGQIFDAYHFVSKLIKKAKNEIILIDNYIDEEILQIFTKTKVKVKILTKNVLNLDIKKLEKQYKNIEIKIFKISHDRFLIIDKEIYLIGASLKDLGKKLFAFSKIEDKKVKQKIFSIIS